MPTRHNNLPTLEEARAIVQFHNRAESNDPAELARLAEETLTDDQADDATKELMVAALFGERTLGGRW